MMMVKGDPVDEDGTFEPDADIVAQMRSYNAELVKAGILLTAEGLQPSARAARLHYSGGKVNVVDGPFAESKELIAGFWIIEVKSMEEAVQWARRIPQPDGAEVDVRLVYDP